MVWSCEVHRERLWSASVSTRRDISCTRVLYGRKVKPSVRRSFLKLHCQQRYVQVSATECHQNRTCGTPLSKARLSRRGFSRKSVAHFVVVESSWTDISKSDAKCRNRGIILFTPFRKAWLSQHRYSRSSPNTKHINTVWAERKILQCPIYRRILWISAVPIFTRIDPEVWKTFEEKFISAATESVTQPNFYQYLDRLFWAPVWY